MIGSVSDKTNGIVDIVKPEEMSNKFTEILSSPLIATHVQLQLYLDPSLFCYDEDDRKIGAKLEKDIGNSNISTVQTFNYGFKTKEDWKTMNTDLLKKKYKNTNDTVYLQVHINYTKLNFSQYLRVESYALDITDNINLTLTNLDFEVLNHRVNQQASNLVFKGDITSSRTLINKQCTLFKRSRKNKRNQRKSFDKQDEDFQKQLKGFKTVYEEEEDEQCEEDNDSEKKKKQVQSKIVKKKKSKRRSDKSAKFLYRARQSRK